jgi:ubiquinone biosynthesis protein
MDAFKDDLYLSMLGSDEAHVDESKTAGIEGVVETMRKYRLRVPMVTMLMIKVLVMVQDDYNLIDPDFDFVSETKPILMDVMKKRMFNQANLQKSVFKIIDAFQNATDLPENVNETFKRLSTGRVTMKIAHDDLDRLGNSIDRAGYKILLGLLLASIVIGMSLVVIATQNVLTAGSFQLTIVVYALVVLIGVFSVFQLIKQRDKR